MGEGKVITGLFVTSILLVGFAFLAITSTFAYPTVNEVLRWDVKYSDVVIGNNKDGKVNVGTDTIDFSAKLDKFGETFSFVTSIKNDGNFDAILSEVKKTDLSKIEIGQSKKTGKIYYVSDYVSYLVTYSGNNNENGVIKDKQLKSGDLLYSGTENKVIVTLKYRNKNQLSEDALEVLKEYGYVFNLDLSLNTLYQER